MEEVAPGSFVVHRHGDAGLKVLLIKERLLLTYTRYNDPRQLLAQSAGSPLVPIYAL